MSQNECCKGNNALGLVRKMTPITVEFKRKVIKYAEENPRRKKKDIAKEFNIPCSTLHTILKNKEKYDENSGLANTCVRAKKGQFTEVEECLVEWLKLCHEKNFPISGRLMQEKAQEFAKNLGHEKFCASNGWLNNFKKRNEIVFRKVYCQSACVDESECTEWKAQIKDEATEYKPEDVYIADECRFSDEIPVYVELTESDIPESSQARNQENQTEEDQEDDPNDRLSPTPKDAYNAIKVLKCFFEKKGFMTESVVRSINELDSVLDSIQANNSKQN